MNHPIEQQTVNLQQAKAQLSRLLELAHGGAEIIVEKAGQPYARLMPLAAQPSRRRPGRLKGQLGAEFFEPLPESELQLWMGSSEPR